MATKIECDRCEEQWNAGDALKEQCTGTVNIPGRAGWDETVSKSWDLCKNCAEKVIELVESPAGKTR